MSTPESQEAWINPEVWNEVQFKKLSKKLGLSFYIGLDSQMYEQGEYGEEERDPTYPEMQMWLLLVPEEYHPVEKSRIWKTRVPEVKD